MAVASEYDVKKTKRDPKLWWILALLNVLVIECSASLYLDTVDGEAHLKAAVVLVGVAIAVAIADLFSIIGALA